MEGQYYLLKILGTGQAVAVFQSWHLLVNPQDILAVTSVVLLGENIADGVAQIDKVHSKSFEVMCNMQLLKPT